MGEAVGYLNMDGLRNLNVSYLTPTQLTYNVMKFFTDSQFRALTAEQISSLDLYTIQSVMTPERIRTLLNPEQARAFTDGQKELLSESHIRAIDDVGSR